MIRAGGPITRERYVLLNWAGEKTEPLSAGDEVDLPPPFRTVQTQ